LLARVFAAAISCSLRLLLALATGVFLCPLALLLFALNLLLALLFLLGGSTLASCIRLSTLALLLFALGLQLALLSFGGGTLASCVLLVPLALLLFVLGLQLALLLFFGDTLTSCVLLSTPALLLFALSLLLALSLLFNVGALASCVLLIPLALALLLLLFALSLKLLLLLFDILRTLEPRIFLLAPAFLLTLVRQRALPSAILNIAGAPLTLSTRARCVSLLLGDILLIQTARSHVRSPCGTRVFPDR
jgi:hypothetical protein